MNKEPSKPKSKSLGRHDACAHPVLARLPEVGDEPISQQRVPRAAAAGFVDYRFDLPAGAEAPEARPRLRVQQPAYRRSPRSEARSQAFTGPSRALPGSNPFAIPDVSLLDRLAPVARFLTLFLLFTAIGTFVLSTTRERSGRPRHDPNPSAAVPAEIEQRLEPTTNEVHPTIASPKAFGPLGASASQIAEESVRLSGLESQSAHTDSTAMNEHLPSLAGANGEPLPQVQTTEISSAPEPAGDDDAARFTGTIEAQHDTPADKSTQPPAVARRLPAIFEAPRNAYQ